jgi:hypothetical protein
MSYFEWCKYAYSKGWATAEQLKVWVAGGKITSVEFEDITGQVYVA